MNLMIHRIALLLPLALLAGCGGEPTEEASTQPRLVPVEVLEIEPASGYGVEQRFVGAVEARRRSRLAFELGGTLERIDFEEGQEVEADAVLARLDTDRLEARRRELDAARAQAVATQDLQQRTLARLEALVDRRAVSDQELDATREQLLTAEAAVRRIDSQIESVDVDLEESELHAPYAGTLARRFADEGAVVAPDQVVFELLETSRLEVRVGLSEEAVRGLRVGDEIAVVDGDSTEVSLPVLRILPQRDPRTRAVDVILDLRDVDLPLRDGDLVEVLRSLSIEEDGFFLPRDALTESVRGLWACYVAVAEPESGPEAHRLDRRDIEVLHEYADLVYVRGALQPGDWVLSTGLHKIAPGQRVRVIEVKTGSEDPAVVAKRGSGIE